MACRTSAYLSTTLSRPDGRSTSCVAGSLRRAAPPACTSISGHQPAASSPDSSGAAGRCQIFFYEFIRLLQQVPLELQAPDISSKRLQLLFQLGLNQRLPGRLAGASWVRIRCGRAADSSICTAILETRPDLQLPACALAGRMHKAMTADCLAAGASSGARSTTRARS